MSVLLGFILLPPSLMVNLISTITFASLVNSGLSEVRGKHVRYSKFWDANNTEINVPSRTGMLVSYIPALVASILSFLIVSNSSSRCLLLSYVLTIHFAKRVFEVMFIHKYSGSMMLDAVIFISANYLSYTIIMIYAQYLTREMATELKIDLMYPGVTLFLPGIIGNFHHHYLLSRLRGKKDDKGYKIPKGGLFGLVVCPHYLFEIIEFIGIAFISQTIYAFAFTLGSMLYLICRSYATRMWYMSKFPNFPIRVRALIPFIY